MSGRHESWVRGILLMRTRLNEKKAAEDSTELTGAAGSLSPDDFFSLVHSFGVACAIDRLCFDWRVQHELGCLALSKDVLSIRRKSSHVGG
jgi:hypothetical protein